MMTQADILAKNEETFTNINIIKDLAETYDSAVAGTLLKNFSNPEASTSPGTALSEAPTTSNQTRSPKPNDFDGNEFRSYALSEQSPIKPSKYFADDR